jgi:light-regulated signal transduction histidine kinase (bacteriophytochrome)
MTSLASGPPATLDLTACDREPIHVPGSIQPHGCLLVLQGPSGPVVQASANAAAWLGLGDGSPLGRTLAELFGPEQGRALDGDLANPALEHNPVYLRNLTVFDGTPVRSLLAVGHRTDGLTVLELETAPAAGAGPLPNFYPLVHTFIGRLGGTADINELSRLAAAEVRELTGFSRVLVYRFDQDWNGTVIAEDRDGRLPSYLGLRFPASDIPRQARELYLRNRVRLIPDAAYEPVPLVPAESPVTGRPLELTYSALRSVSPVHREYMHNMGTAASMSVAVLCDGRLWGLLSCHHPEPRTVPFDVRATCDTLGQVLSLQIAARERAADYEDRIRLKSAQSRLLAHMTREAHFIDGLTRHPDELLGFARADGAAVLFEQNCALVGRTPTEGQVRALADWLTETVGEEAFATDALAGAFPPAAAYAGAASGLLAVGISKLHRSFVLWFRPEVIQTVQWGGDPRKPAEPGPAGLRLHPRRSFELWQETVRQRSAPWARGEVDAAADLRNSIVGIVLRKAEELAELSGQLERSNKELEAFCYTVSHDLRAPFRHILGYAELLQERRADLDAESRRYMDVIIESARYAGALVDNLLSFSRIGRSTLDPMRIDMNQLVREVRQEVAGDEAAGRNVEWVVHDLPAVRADLILLRLVVRNLLSNAVKYTRARAEARVEVGARPEGREWVFFVRDNGVGFDMAYQDKLFGVFQRLHRMEDFEGTGIGLATVRRIVGRHGGRTWAESAVDQGATFYFTLPNPEAPEEGEHAQADPAGGRQPQGPGAEPAGPGA